MSCYEFQNGAAPEAIRLDYSTLSLEQVYGAITFYLGNKEEVERDMAELRRIEEEFMKAHPNPPGLKAEAAGATRANIVAANLTDDPLYGGCRP